MTGPDRIALTGLTVRGRHGVLPAERRDGQDFVVDAVLHLDLRPAAASDDLADTVDYGALAEPARRRRGGRAGRPAGDPGRAAGRGLPGRRRGSARREVTVHKPAAPIPLAFADVAVTVVRP